MNVVASIVWLQLDLFLPKQSVFRDRPFQLLEGRRREKQGFQYFSSLPVHHYLQGVLFIKIGTIFMNIIYTTLFKIWR